jgi:hypothetical protein
MSRTNTSTDKSVNPTKLFWMTVTFVVLNFAIGMTLFHHTFEYAVTTSIEDVFMALAVWYLIADRIY